MTTYYALYQSGHVVYGVGSSEAEARENAREWLDVPEDADSAELLTGNHGETEGDLYVRRCTDRLYQAVLDGDMLFQVDSEGYLDLQRGA